MRFTMSVAFFMSFFTASAQQECDCDSTFNFIYKQWAEVQNMSYHSYKNERKIEVYEEANFDFVVQRKPFKVAGVTVSYTHLTLPTTAYV